MYANVWNDFVYRNINVIGEIFPSEKKTLFQNVTNTLISRFGPP